MRISDWSSDVCSSDPRDVAARAMGFGRAGDGFRRWLYPSYGLPQLRVVAGVRQIPQPVVDALAAVDRIVVVEMPLRHVEQVHQIGRPSVRERVCQHVVISVGAGALKKKKKYMK